MYLSAIKSTLLAIMFSLSLPVFGQQDAVWNTVHYRDRIAEFAKMRSGFVKWENEEEINNNPSFEMSENEQLKLMIKALFNLYFEPIDIEQYKKDNTLIQTAEDFDQLNVECFNAYKRLSNPLKSYIKKRDN